MVPFGSLQRPKVALSSRVDGCEEEGKQQKNDGCTPG